jgi:hypothetical protein
VKITNNTSVFDSDKITTSGNYDDEDDDKVVSSIATPHGITPPVAITNMVSSSTTTDVCIAPPLPFAYDMMMPSLPNHIYDVPLHNIENIDTMAPSVAAHVENIPIEFLCNKDDDASLFAGLMNGNDDDDDMDGSSISAVDELLSLDQILGFDSTELDIHSDWL